MIFGIDTSYDWHSKDIIPSITLRINLSSDKRCFLYSDGKNRGGILFFSVHGATFDQSN